MQKYFQVTCESDTLICHCWDFSASRLTSDKDNNNADSVVCNSVISRHKISVQADSPLKAGNLDVFYK